MEMYGLWVTEEEAQELFAKARQAWEKLDEEDRDIYDDYEDFEDTYLLSEFYSDV